MSNQWFNCDTDINVTPPVNRPLLAYCPEWCDTKYSVVTYNGRHFECDTHEVAIHPYVEAWTLFMEHE